MNMRVLSAFLWMEALFDNTSAVRASATSHLLHNENYKDTTPKMINITYIHSALNQVQL